MTDDTKTIISGTVRTLAQFVPLAGGAIAQAWSEYENFNQSKRTESFFAELRDSLEKLQSNHADLSTKIASMPDAAELLELTVGAARRESNEVKRQIFSRLYSNFISQPEKTTPAERMNIVHHVEQLVDIDLLTLKKFVQHGGTMRGDMLTNTVEGGWTQVGTQNIDTKWLQIHGETVHSIAKLASRGLIHQVTLNMGFSSSGISNSSFDAFRQRAWSITPIGSKLVASIGATS